LSIHPAEFRAILQFQQTERRVLGMLCSPEEDIAVEVQMVRRAIGFGEQSLFSRPYDRGVHERLVWLLIASYPLMTSGRLERLVLEV
jgi:hypothetical protein